MKAAILEKTNQPLVIDWVSLPEKLEVGQVLVKIYHSGICGSQLGEINAVKGEDKFLPHLLGHEGAGVVELIGPGVTHVNTSDKVVLHWRRSQGIECKPPCYGWRGRPLNAGLITTFSEYAIVSENRLTRIDDCFDMKIATLFGCAVTTGFGVVERDAKINFGESVVVFGAGGVGLNIIKGAELRSAYPIIAVDLHDSRLRLAKELGATHLINATTTDAAEAITEIEREGVDVFIDNTGLSEIIELGYRLTHKRGRVILVGVPRIGDAVSVYTLPLHFGKVINGSHGGSAVPHIDIPRYLKLHKNSNLQLEKLITEEYHLEEINTALSRMQDGSLTGRCLISM